MKISDQELKHVKRVLLSDISECTNLLEADIPNERVSAIASRMEESRHFLERIENEVHTRHGR
jgi:hypothetical protein